MYNSKCIYINDQRIYHNSHGIDKQTHIKTNKHHLLRHAEIGAALCVSAGGWGAVGELMIFLYHVQTAR